MLQIKLLLHGRQNKIKRWLEACGGVDFGDGIKQPLGIETEALFLDFSRLKAIFKKQFDNITSGSFLGMSEKGAIRELPLQKYWV